MSGEANHTELVAFHLTGDRSGGQLSDVAGLALRPVLFAGYGDLTTLRYDYPLVLANHGQDQDALFTLSGIVDRVLGRIAPQGIEGEFARQQLLGLESEIRSAMAGGAQGTLAELWRQAGERLSAGADQATGKQLSELLARAETALAVDGQVVDCDGQTPGRVLRHLWAAGQRQKNDRLRHRLDTLILGLKAILQADFAKSEAGRSPAQLKGAMGEGLEAAFDFEAMSKILPQGSAKAGLPKERRRRLRATLKVLQGQRFVAPSDVLGKSGANTPHEFVFDSCRAAMAAFEERLPEIVALAKALSVAELEMANRFDPLRHEPYFKTFDETSLRPDDVAQFPGYLVLLADGGAAAAERAAVIDLLSSDLPIKVLVQSDDLLGEDGAWPGQIALGGNNLHFANMAIGINSAFVLQSASAGLYRLAEPITRGLDYAGPALFSIFSGAAGANGSGGSYLAAASAAESRVFPAFVFDPAAGPDLASRFSIVDNPQIETDWPEHDLSYEAEHHRRVDQKLDFTFADFVAADGRYAQHLAAVPNGDADGQLVPAGEYLRRQPGERRDCVPYVLMVDGENLLHKIVVGEALIRAAERCGERWRVLQELGGVHNSHAARLVESERRRWDEEKQLELDAARAPAETAGAPVAAASPSEAVPVPATPAPVPASEPEPAAAPSEAAAPPVARPEEPPTPQAPAAEPGEPWIDTAQCNTCKECSEINSRMFGYDENQQAYILDPDAGSFAEMVEAAENCQVAIIHPGKPRYPDEPDLEDLIERAAEFN